MTEIRARLGVFSTAAVAGVAGIGLLLAGCGSSTTPAGAGASAASSSMSGHSMSPGMSMAPGESMTPGESIAPAAATTDPAAPSSTTPTPAPTNAAASKPATSRPSKTALMVCGDDISGQIRSVLKLTKPAPTTSTFKNGLYTCAYTLPQGKLVLSVKQSNSLVAAGKYFDAARSTLPATHKLFGLGERAYATKTGVAVVIKDDQTLRVDATGLPAVFGSEHQKRTDLAYEIASDVLGCWTGDGDE